MPHGFCDICGMPNCDRIGHKNEFPYEGTQDELNAIQGEIRDIQTQRAELDRQHALLQEHRLHVLGLLGKR